MRKISFNHRRTNASALYAHIVFCTKYRRRVISDRVFRLARKTMIRSMARLGAKIIEINAEGDHVRVMLLYPPALSLSTLVKHLKGASSRAVRFYRYPEVMRKLRGAHLWAPSYCVVSCGGAPLEIIQRYIQNQAPRETSPKRPGKPMFRTRQNRRRCIPAMNYREFAADTG